jgi:type I restriction-modification system DNA methylase subunit
MNTPLILDFTVENGLVLCDRPDDVQNGYERLYLSEVSKLDAYAVFFRRHFKTKDAKQAYKSEPAVCIFKEEDVPLNSPKHKEIHAALWSEGKIDIYIIIRSNTRLDIYNVRQPAVVKKGENELSVDSLKFAAEAIEELEKKQSAAHLFGTGTFWEETEKQKSISVERSPYQHLIDYLMKVREDFYDNSKNQLQLDTIDKILVLSILVKFLEEKKDSGTDRSTLDDIYAKLQVENLVDAVEKGRFLAVLSALSTEFNGKVFDQFSQDQEKQVQETDLTLLAQFLRADIDIATKQLFLWEQYSFQHLPAEVISAIYENFIQEEAKRDGKGPEKGVVYTPIHLVNFMVDEVMPLDNPPPSFIENGLYKILDPTCGSGIFLVSAYKRLLQWWAIAESEKTGEIRYPDVLIAQKILEDNIFGVDVKKTAIRVTIFGLTTALLDVLTPKEVWENLKFQDLSKKNIIKWKDTTGFFGWALEAKLNNDRFSLVLGNPPFNEEKGTTKKEVLKKEVLDSLELRHAIPGGNFALHFFETSMLLADRICMIIPSNILLYTKSDPAKNYREQIFTNYSVSDIYDFTHLRETLFIKKGGKKKVGRTPVVALFAENKPSTFKAINHTVVKRTISVDQKVRFEIDDYDRHLVKWDWAVDPEKQFIWKTNLLGGGRLFHLIYRLNLFLKFGNLISEKKWVSSIGYKLEGKGKPARYITGNDVIISETFDEFEDYETFIESNTEFAEPRNEKIYTAPHLIYKIAFSPKNIPIHYSEKHLCFRARLVGIHAPIEEKEDLLSIYRRFKNEEFRTLARFWILSTSAEAMVMLETSFKKEDVDNLPFPADPRAISFSGCEKLIIDDVLDYYIHLGKQITKKSDGAILHHPVKKEQLEEYGEVLCTELNDIYAKDGNNWQSGKIYRMPSYTIYQIGFGADGKLNQEFTSNQLDDSIQKLINNDSNRGAAYKRIVRLYDHVDGFDCVYFIKPNAFRYWLKSIALRDADETFSDLRAEDY